MSGHDEAGTGKAPLRIGMLVGSASVSGGGVVEVVRSLALALDRIPTIQVEVFAPEGGIVRDFGQVALHSCRVYGPRSFGYAPALVSAMRRSDLDLVHVHGLWMYISIAARQWARATGRPYIVSPHGMLDPWALGNGATKKRLARLLYENRHLGGASCIHALCAAEAEAVRAAAIATPIDNIPNGVDAPDGSAPVAPWRKALGEDAKVLLFLGRVTEKKKVLELVRAFARTWRAGNPWHLVIVGPAAPDYLAAIAAGADGLQGQHNIHLVGPAYGQERESAYASAHAFILPSVSEGLPMAALEAFANGLPALLSPQCNLPEAFTCGAAIRIGCEEEAIAAGLTELFAWSDGERAARGRNALSMAQEGFSWDQVGERMAALYRRQIADHARVSNLRRSLTGRAGFPA